MRSRIELRQELDDFLSGRRHSVFSEVEKTLKEIYEYLGAPPYEELQKYHNDAVQDAWNIVSDYITRGYSESIEKFNHAVGVLNRHLDASKDSEAGTLPVEQEMLPKMAVRADTARKLVAIQHILDTFDASQIDDVDCLCKIAEIMQPYGTENAENLMTDPRYSRDEDDEGPEGKCVLCGGLFADRFDRNNPWPLATEGDCCSVCNMTKVVPERIRRVIGDGA